MKNRRTAAIVGLALLVLASPACAKSIDAPPPVGNPIVRNLPPQPSGPIQDTVCSKQGELPLHQTAGSRDGSLTMRLYEKGFQNTLTLSVEPDTLVRSVARTIDFVDQPETVAVAIGTAPNKQVGAGIQYNLQPELELRVSRASATLAPFNPTKCNLLAFEFTDKQLQSLSVNGIRVPHRTQ